jgi:hypothetical protein
VVDPSTTPQAQVVWTGRDAFVVRLQWRPEGEQGDREMYQVLRFRDDKIQEMADYRALGEATRTAKRFAGRTGR